MNIFWLQRKKCINYLICVSLLALLFVLIQNYFITTKVYHYLYPKESLYCYRICSNTLTDISEETPVKGKSIFFHETSCNSFFNGKTTITARQACAVESAAKMNPGMGVHLLFTSPGRLKFEGDESDDILRALLSYENVKLLHVNFDDYTKDTPVEELYKSGLLDDSEYAQSHASDVLRYLTLWKYGGIYLDLDVIVVRSLEELAHNYAGCESDRNVAAGVMSFSPDGLGHQLAKTCLEDLRDNFDGRDWGNNGPGVITRLLRRICGTQQAKDMITKDCQGFQVYPPDRFYAVPWTKWHMYFDENATRTVFNMSKNSYIIHVWNKHSQVEELPLDSEAAYMVYAKKFCPRVVAQCREGF
nr:unnamed protein product [Callosobruchus analis]